MDLLDWSGIAFRMLLVHFEVAQVMHSDAASPLIGLGYRFHEPQVLKEEVLQIPSHLTVEPVFRSTMRNFLIVLN